MDSSLTFLDRKRRLSTSSNSDNDSSTRNVRAKQDTLSPFFDDHTDFLLDALVLTDKDHPLYMRSADELRKICQGSYTSLSFHQLLGAIKSKDTSEEKTAEIMDLLEPALGGKISAVLSASSYRPRTIVQMVQNLIIVGKAKHGQGFADELRRLTANDEKSQGMRVPKTQAISSDELRSLATDERVKDTKKDEAFKGSAELEHRSRVSASRADTSPSVRAKRPLSISTMEHSPPTGPVCNVPDTERSPRPATNGPRIPQSELDPCRTLFLRMYTRPKWTQEEQELAIIIGCKERLGQACGVKTCQALRSGYAIVFDTSEHAGQAIDMTLCVDGYNVTLEQFYDRRPPANSWRPQDWAGPPEEKRPPSDQQLQCPTPSTLRADRANHHRQSSGSSLASRTYFSIVPAAPAIAAEQNIVRAVADWLPERDLRFNIQRQRSRTRDDRKYWVLVFNREPPLNRPHFKVEINMGKLKRPFVATFDRVRAGNTCVVCQRQSHDVARCSSVEQLPSDFNLDFKQYLRRVPD